MNHLDQLTLSLLVDEMLPQKTADQCYKHIESCPQCEQAFDDLQAMSFALTKLPDVAPPQGFSAMSQHIMANLPPQDAVSTENVIEIQEHHVKQDFLASLDWKQFGICAACFLLLSSSFFAPEDSSLEHSSSSSSDSLMERSVTPEESIASAMMEGESDFASTTAGGSDLPAVSYDSPESAPELSSALSIEDVVHSHETWNPDFDYQGYVSALEENPYILPYDQLSPMEEEIVTNIDFYDFLPRFIFILEECPPSMDAFSWSDDYQGYQSTIVSVDAPEAFFQDFPELSSLFSEDIDPWVQFYRET